MNHPHKISRKKLRDENERLKKQLLSAQLITGIVAQASAVQIATLKASFCSKQITESGGTIVEVNNSVNECFAGLKEDLERIGNITKLDNITVKV